jgi:hypothetical protein
MDTNDRRHLASPLVASHAVSATPALDAVPIASAATRGMTERVGRAAGLVPPVICAPEE